MYRTLLRDMRRKIHFNNSKQIKRLLKLSVRKPFNKNSFISGNHKLLKLAIGFNQKKLIEFLMKKDVRLNNNYKMKYLFPSNTDIKLKSSIDVNDSAFNIAGFYNNFEHSRSLLQHYTTVNSTIICNSYIIADTVLSNSLQLTRLLLQHGAQVNSTISDKYLEDRAKYMEIAERIKSFGNATLLHAAIATGNVNLVELLIDYGADINSRTKFLQRTPLLLAIEEYNPEIVRLLLKTQASVDVLDENGMSPLHYIICNEKNVNNRFSKDMLEGFNDKKMEILRLLIRAGVNVNEALQPLGNKLTFLKTAITYGQKDIILFLAVNNHLDCSLFDYSIIETTKLNRNLLTEDQRNDLAFIENLEVNTYQRIENYLVMTTLTAYYRQVPIDEKLLARIRLKPVNYPQYKSAYKLHIDNTESYLFESVNHMKTHKFRNSNITTWDFLTSPSDRIINYVRHKDVRNFNFDKYFSKNIFYRKIFNTRKNAAVKRIKLLERTAEIMFILLKYLPLTCCEKIVDNFDNKELKKFYTQFFDIVPSEYGYFKKILM